MSQDFFVGQNTTFIPHERYKMVLLQLYMSYCSCIQLTRREQTSYNNNVLPDFLHYSLRGFHPLVGRSGAATWPPPRMEAAGQGSVEGPGGRPR